MANPAADGLKIGDFITLKTTKWECFLGAEGILAEDLYVHDALEEFDDSIFQIHSQRQYSASRELLNFLETHNIDENDEHEHDGVKQYLKALKKGRDNEVRLNDMYMEQKTGMSIHFGDTIQLFHVKSRKYLLIDPKKLAKNERENSSVELECNGNTHSWFQFMPRFKIDREGDRILTNSELYIRVAERNNEYIHCADKSPKTGTNREVNCSLEQTAWRLTIFQSCLENKENPTMVLASKLLYIHDPETKTNLTVGERQAETFDAEGVDPEEKGHEFYHDSGDIIATPMGEFLNLRCIWSIETKALVRGGGIQWKTDQVRLKNLATGVFLTTVDASVSKHNTEESELLLTTTSDVLDPGTLFKVIELNSLENELKMSKALQIHQEGYWLTRGPEIEEGTMEIKLTKNKDAAVCLLANEYVQFAVEAGPEAEESVNESDKEPLDVHTGMSFKRLLWKYLNMTVIPRRKHVTTLWPDSDQADLEFFNHLITRSTNFAQGFMVSESHVTLGVDKANQLVRVQRQNLMRELGIVEVTLRIINRLKPTTEMFDYSVARKTPLNDSDQALLDFGNNILSKCLSLIYYCLLENYSNQMLVADYLPDLLAHLSTQPLAGKCVTSMLGANMDLQEEKIDKDVLNIFVEKLKKTPMSRMYFNLLQSCCSCQGQGVDGNQCDVAELLFEDPTGIVIDLVVDGDKRTKEVWKESIFAPATIAERQIEGVDLREKGLPDLFLKWESPGDYSPTKLFGTEVVPITKILPPTLNMNPTEEIAKKRTAVARYFIDEMYLGAEMCMDRNYVSMHCLDPIFPFEGLVSIMKMKGVHNEVKAAACRLLFCLHVDRDPQACTKIPCLTRTWLDIKESEEPKLPTVEPEREYVYGLIQQLCSEHVRGMSGHRWDIYSRYILQMLRGLIGFNFYGTVERMNDVIGPMLHAIDRRLVEYEKPNASRRKSSVAVVTMDGQDVLFNRENSWQKRHYDQLESLPVMCAILALVLAAVGITIWQVITDAPETTGLMIFGYIVLAIFLYDFLVRMYCYVFVNQEVSPFLKNPYNIIDMVVILIDIAFLAVGDGAGEGGSFAKSLRLIRLVRLIRVLRAAKVIAAVSKEKDVVVKWNAPARYTKIPAFELETMTEAISLLLFVQGVIEDRNLSILLRYFEQWEKGKDTRTPAELFEQALEDSAELTLDVNDFNHVLVDALMFIHSPLVQGSLDVLMTHHSSRLALLENAANAQIIVSKKRQQEFVKIRRWVSTLEQNAETHELWGELESDDDHKLNKETKEILRELISCVRVRRFTFEFDEDYEPVEAVQDMLRNLGIYDITPKVLGLMESVEEEEDGSFSDVAKNTKDICTLCNEVLYWCTIGNTANQEILYDNIGDFLDSLDDEINSHHVIKAILRGNEALMNAVPHSLLDSMVSKIVNESHKHQYLALASSITHVGEKNIPKNQFEIIRGLCNPERLSETAIFLVPVDHDDYFEKKRLMAPFKESQDVNIDSLPPLLAYHLQYLEVLSNCTSGKINISAVEAKVQSIFGLKDIIEAILDEDTILVAKIRLSQFLLNSIIDVDMALPGLCESKYMWNLIESYVETLNFAKDEIRTVEKLGWESPEVSRHRIEYIITTILTIGSFFEKNYNAEKIRNDDGTSSEDRVQLSLIKINEIIRMLYDRIFEIYDLDTPRLTTEVKGQMYDTLHALNKSASAIIVTHIEPIHLRSAGLEEEEPDPDEVHEQAILEKYKEFVEELSSDEDVQENAKKQVDHFLELIEEMPSIYEKTATADIRVEPFLQKLVAHVRENMVVSEHEKKLDSGTTKTTLWMIKAFRTWLENKMEMSIEDRDDDGGDEEDEKAAPTVALLNNNGITALCLELIAPGIDETLQSEVVKLMVGLLFKEGGARDVQQKINECLTGVESVLFFKQVRATLQKLIAWHQWHGVIEVGDGEDPELPDDIIIVRMLQLLSEGHYLPNQDIMREQPKNVLNINLLDDFVQYFNTLSRIPCLTSTAAADAVGNTIVEVIQGPCTGNQIHFALNTELLETMNRVLRAKSVNDCDDDAEEDLKKCCVDAISALLEGQKPSDQVTIRILSVIHLDIVQYLATPKEILEATAEGEEEEEPVPGESEGDGEKEGEGGEEEEEEEGGESLQTDCVVLLQSLCDYKPSIREEIEADGDGLFDFESAGKSTASIEVTWNGALNRRFFNIPAVCNLLSKPSKDRLVQDVDRSNSENKLLDFMYRAQHLYLEIKHQEDLKKMGIASVFSPEVHNAATWFTFCCSIIINVLFLVYYDATSGEPAIPGRIRSAISGLNYVQITVSVFTIILTFVVRSPVIFRGHEKEGNGLYTSILYTATDPMTLYYIWYLLFACLGAFLHDMYITFLLLDLIVKNPTTADILLSVVNPHKSLIVAFVMGAFVIYIYTFFIFIFMPYRIIADDDMTPGGMDGLNCITLWGCYKYVFAYGFRAGGGVGEVMFGDNGDAVWLHLTFFLVVTVAMLNIIFGIIIDTFSGLRSEKNERAYDTTETCFICSLGRQVFDRAANSPDGFKNHIRDDHHMWNYLYFIFFLWEQDKDDDDGLEYYVRHKIINNEITWFPMSNAMCLDMGATDHEVMRGEVLDQIQAKEGELIKRLNDLEEDVNVVLDRISGAIDYDYSSADSIKLGIASYLKKVNEGTLEVEQQPVLPTTPLVSSLEGNIIDDVSVVTDASGISKHVGLCALLTSIFLPAHGTTEDMKATRVTFITPRQNTFSQDASAVEDSTIIFDSPETVQFSADEEQQGELQVGIYSGNLAVAAFEVPVQEIAQSVGENQLKVTFKVGDVDCIAKFSCMRVSVV